MKKILVSFLSFMLVLGVCLGISQMVEQKKVKAESVASQDFVMRDGASFRTYWSTPNCGITYMATMPNGNSNVSKVKLFVAPYDYVESIRGSSTEAIDYVTEFTKAGKQFLDIEPARVADSTETYFTGGVKNISVGQESRKWFGIYYYNDGSKNIYAQMPNGEMGQARSIAYLSSGYYNSGECTSENDKYMTSFYMDRAIKTAVSKSDNNIDTSTINYFDGEGKNTSIVSGQINATYLDDYITDKTTSVRVGDEIVNVGQRLDFKMDYSPFSSIINQNGKGGLLINTVGTGNITQRTKIGLDNASFSVNIDKFNLSSAELTSEDKTFTDTLIANGASLIDSYNTTDITPSIVLTVRKVNNMLSDKVYDNNNISSIGTLTFTTSGNGANGDLVDASTDIVPSIYTTISGGNFVSSKKVTTTATKNKFNVKLNTSANADVTNEYKPTLPESIDQDYYYGQSYSYNTSMYGHSAYENESEYNSDKYAGTVGASDVSKSLEYRPKEIPVKVTYDMESKTTETLPNNVSENIKFGHTKTYESASYDGYSVNHQSVSYKITSETDKYETSVYYSLKSYDLEITYTYSDENNYEDKGGKEASTTYTANIKYKSTYSEDSPSITGYTPNSATVSGTMSCKNTTIAVTYNTNQYALTIKTETGGSVSTDVAKPYYKQTVTLTKTRENRYGLDSASLSGTGYSQTINFTNPGGEATNTFTMPATDVTVAPNVEYYGTISFDSHYDVISGSSLVAYNGYYVDVTPTFSVNNSVNKVENITYTSSDTSKVTISGSRFNGVAVGTATITAKTTYITEKFNIAVNNATNLNTEFTTYLNELQTNLNNFNHDSSGFTLFIGDSFFDSRYFFTDFYTRFAGKNAFTWGISSSKAEQWVWYCQKIWKYNPSSIVIHIGTNDYFDGGRNQSTIETSIKTLFAEIHKNLPNCKIYWYSIENRIYSGANNSVCQAVNSTIKSYANSNTSWLKYLDSYTPTSKNTTLYRDSVHLKTPTGYDTMMSVLTNSEFSFANNSLYSTIGNFTTASTEKVASSRVMPYAQGSFLWKSNVTINSRSNNAHISMNFNGLSSDRFLMWDSGSNGNFYATTTIGNVYNNTSNFSISDKDFELAVLVTGHNGYLFVNKSLKAIYTELYCVEYFTVGTESMSATFANNKVYGSSAGEYTTYKNITGVSDYENYNIVGKEYIDNSASFNPNKTTTNVNSPSPDPFVVTTNNKGSFVWEGFAKINSTSSNPHISLGLAGNHDKNRFLVWSKSNNGHYNITAFDSSGKEPGDNSTYVDLSSNAVYLAVYYDGTHVYFFVNGRMELCYIYAKGVLTSGVTLTIGSQGCNVTFSKQRYTTSGVRLEYYKNKHGVERYKNDDALSDGKHGSFIYSDVTRNKIENYSTVNGTDTFGSSKDMGVSGAFAWRAYVNVTAYSKNAHLTLNLNGASNTRFLLWNSNNDGKFYVGGMCNGEVAYTISTSKNYYTTGSGWQLEVYYDGTHAYFFVNYYLKAVYTNINVKSFTVGTEGMSADFSSIYRFKPEHGGFYGKNNYYEYTQRAGVGLFSKGMKNNGQVSLIIV